MVTKRVRRKRIVDPVIRRTSQRPSPGLLDQVSLRLDSEIELPRIVLRSASFHPFLYRKMIDQPESSARPGDLVQVLDKQGEPFGYGLFNHRSEIALRMLTYGHELPDERFWQQRLERAVQLRREFLSLDRDTDAYRVVHAEADGLTGLVVDRLGDTLSAEVYSLGIFKRVAAILDKIKDLSDARHWIAQVPDHVHGQEGFLSDPVTSSRIPEYAMVTEYGTRFRVRFDSGHKTGFFCDQRENRRRVAALSEGRSVLDLCCFTGGFALQARRIGGATDVTGVDLDEKAIRQARENANLNQVRVNFVHADAFAYMRDMISGGRKFGVVVLDPPKLIRSRRELDEGRRKHFDLNRLAMQLVAPGGLLLTCSCSGLLPESDFLELVHAAARKATPQVVDSVRDTDVDPRRGRSIQILARSGAAPDHPVVPFCPESEYLKAVWLRVL